MIAERRRSRSGDGGAFSVDALLATGAGIGSTAIAALTSIVIARVLGPEDRGISSAVLSLAVLLSTLVSLGLPSAGAYALARVDEDERPRVARAVLRAAVALAVIGFVAYLGLAAWVAVTGTSAVVLAWGAAGTSALVLQGVLQQLVLTGGSIRWFAAAQLVPAVGLLVVVAVLAIVDALDVTTVVAMSAVMSFAGALTGWTGLRRHGAASPSVALGARQTLATLRPLAKLVGQLFVISSMAQLIQRLDILIIEGYRGPEEAGYYTVAAQSAAILMIIPAALGALVFRRGARAEANHWDDALRALRWTALAGVAGACIAAVAAEEVLVRVVGEDYLPAVTPFRLLLPGIVLLGFQSVVSNYVAGRGHAGSIVVAWTTAGVVAVGGGFAVIPHAGAEGAAIVSSIAYGLVLLLHLRVLLSLRPRRDAAAGAR